MIPISTDTPIRRTPWANYALIAANVLVFVAMMWAEWAQHAAHSGRMAPSSLAGVLLRGRELCVLSGDEPLLYQFFTYQFLHAGFAHLAGNMLFLWVFGNPVNGKMGHGPYVLFYLSGGVFAAAAYALMHDASMLGASGAIAAVTTAYLAMFPRSYITIIYWFIFIGTFELPSMLMIVFKMILWDNVLAPRMVGESNVAFAAHLAGYAFGFVISAALLGFRVLPRDQFDIVALWRRWLQRYQMQTVMADPEARARAQFGRVARPVSVDGVNVRTAAVKPDQVTELRLKIAESLAQNDRDTAAGLYEKLMELDPRQVLARSQQLDVANQLYTLGRLPQAAAAYEKFLTGYPGSPEADHVKLLLGIIYARDLQQYEVAEGHLRQLLGRLADEKRRQQCAHWLAVADRAMGRPAPDA